MVNAYKSHYGWKAESNVDLFEGKVLNIVTMKRSSGQLVTTANAAQDLGDGSISYMMFQDFRVNVVSSSPKRVNEKVVLEQHNGVVQNIADVVAQAKAFYGKV